MKYLNDFNQNADSKNSQMTKNNSDCSFNFELSRKESY